jgi:hypothetical protein
MWKKSSPKQIGLDGWNLLPITPCLAPLERANKGR